MLLLCVAVSLIDCLAIAACPQQPTAAAARQVQIRARVCDAQGQPLAGAGLLLGAEHEITTRAALTTPQARAAEDGAVEFLAAVPSAQLEQATVLLIAAPGKVTFRFPNPLAAVGSDLPAGSSISARSACPTATR